MSYVSASVKAAVMVTSSSSDVSSAMRAANCCADSDSARHRLSLLGSLFSVAPSLLLTFDVSRLFCSRSLSTCSAMSISNAEGMNSSYLLGASTGRGLAGEGKQRGGQTVVEGKQ